MPLAHAVSARGERGLAGAERPVAPSDRIAAIDSVRGIALFGVMAINVVTEFRVSIFEQFLPAQNNGSWFDRALHSILMVGINLKALALFSLLFGAGLAIQHDMGRKETSRGYTVFIASDRIDIFAPSLRGPGHPNDYVMIDRFTGTLRGVWRREAREISVDGRCTRTQEQKF
jgi:hypothetical protein